MTTTVNQNQIRDLINSLNTKLNNDKVIQDLNGGSSNVPSVIAVVNGLNTKQDTLVSGTNIKTINNTSLLGDTNISVQEPLVSGTNIKTINNESMLGSGNLTIGRNIGEIVTSTIPLKDSALHLLDGSLLSGSGVYADFVNYFAELVNDETERVFTQPILSSNGTLGGTTFACQASSILSGTSGIYTYGDAYYAFDNNTNTAWHGAQYVFPADLIFYNPQPLKVSKLTITNWGHTSHITGITSGTIFGSNDNTNWTSLTTFTNSQTASGASWDIDVNSSNYYNYYKIQVATSAYDYAVIGGVQITAVYDKPLFCIPESAWQASVNTYGVCGKFVYDSVNNTVRLPKIEGFTESTINPTNLGNLTEAGLPNIEGGFISTNTYGSGISPTEAFTSSSSGERGGYGGGNGRENSHYWVYMSASRCSSIYKNDFQKVQPQSIKVLYYIVIANSIKTEIQVDIDEIVTDLNGKADVDLTNCTDVANIKMANASMPSTTYKALTLGASGAQYTAPADGWVFIRGKASAAGQYLALMKNNSSLEASVMWSVDNNTDMYANAPVRKGEVYGVNYTMGGTSSNNYFRFYYAEGSKSEA